MKWIRSHRIYILLCGIILTIISMCYTIIHIPYYNLFLVFRDYILLNPNVLLSIILIWFIRYDDYRNRRNRMICAICYLSVSFVSALLSTSYTIQGISQNAFWVYQLMHSVITLMIRAILLLMFAYRKQDNGDKWFIIVCAITFGIEVIDVLILKSTAPLISWISVILTFCIAFLNGEIKEETKKTEYSYLEEYKRNLKR